MLLCLFNATLLQPAGWNTNTHSHTHTHKINSESRLYTIQVCMFCTAAVALLNHFNYTHTHTHTDTHTSYVSVLSAAQHCIQVFGSYAFESHTIILLSLQLQGGGSLFSERKINNSLSRCFSQLAPAPALLQHLLPSPLATASNTVRRAGEG